jgi:hypothetical protein
MATTAERIDWLVASNSQALVCFTKPQSFFYSGETPMQLALIRYRRGRGTRVRCEKQRSQKMK